MSDKTAKIVFTPSGRRGDFPVGTPVLQAARQLGVDVDSVCGGRAICGRCQVVCAEGSFPKHAIVSNKDSLSGFNETERQFEKRKKIKLNDRRLSCQALILSDVVIDVPPESQVHRQVVRKAADYRDIILNTTTHLYYVEVAPASMDEPKGDMQRLLEALDREWSMSGLSYNLRVLQELQIALRKEQWAVTVAIYDGQQIVAIWPGYKEVIYGVACDVGSTTIAAHLCNLTTGEVLASGGIMNPQIRFGEDLMSRVSYVMMHPEGADEMTRAVRQGVRELIREVTTEIDASPEDVLEVSVVWKPHNASSPLGY